ncbi:hypothetical protein HRR83_005342 [Exophiala dermatitidis]|uniref:Uncharacterized protein n=1 Tax=Exophiala dermatitidis TaxID=5970 RepID=A0AAN6IUR7_EXODE|nr:hypothetical protein HRR74_005195 [Exophiala dermatitidis]KAJ4518557.1 hypothetical protein HRR73_004138 [Exophiala dermatitidis]KAJ4534058.1 hypothetical protein HRR76_006003 [Exophiala dermatitidis]KAJ4550214.1 hypothetical protein HRR77_003689 [Exophiala dermatitidis]KAJ4571541.1 hypothetical protein HRR81_005572 [Exophiala dermatitidis]
MAPRATQAFGLPTSRTPSPPDSIHSTSSSSTYVSSRSSSSSISSSSSSPSVSKAVAAPPPMYSSTSTPRPRRLSPPQTLLGAIDENSGTVEPDVPLSVDKGQNPIAKLHVYSSAINSKKKATLASMSSPPTNEFDSLLGPNGEKFADLRMNRKVENSRSRGWKNFMCFG